MTSKKNNYLMINQAPGYLFVDLVRAACSYNNKICITFDKYENYFDIVSNITLNFI